MEAFRPPLPGYIHGQLCPVCMTTHFPFCAPRHHPRLASSHHAQFEVFRPPQSYLGSPHTFPESRFRAPIMTPDSVHRHPPFTHGYGPHFVEDYRLPPPMQDQFQSFHAPSHTMSQRGGNPWVDAERNANFQQHRRIGQDSGETFFPRVDYYHDESNSTNRLAGSELQTEMGQVAQAGISVPWSQGFSGRQSLPLEETKNAEINTFSSSGSLVNVSNNLDRQLNARHAAHIQQNTDFQKHGLKRKQPLSREEELLIEKGLLDDDKASSCPMLSNKAIQLNNQHTKVASINSHHQLHGKQNEDILQKQYEEWEAEEKQLVALRQTENNEIKKQDKGSWCPGAMQSSTTNSTHAHSFPQMGNFSQLPHQSQQLSCYSDLQSSNHDHKHQQSFMQHSKQEQWEHQRENTQQATSLMPQWKESPYTAHVNEGQQYRHLVPTEQAPKSVHQVKEQSIKFNHDMGQWHGKTQQVQYYEQASYQYKKPIELQNLQSHAHLSAYHANLPETLRSEGHYQSGPITGPVPPPLPPPFLDPPPPCSPPPPLPASDYPCENMPPLPPLPPPVATILNATGQGSLGNTQHYQVQQQQKLRPCNLSYGAPESLHSQHTALNFSHQVSQASGPLQSHAPQKLERSKTVDAVNIFMNPGRITRPERFVVILRGLPGSGKSYLAKALRDVEVTNGGSAPRIHSMDDYFMSEVEMVEEVETGASNLRSKKKVVKKVMEYCYEAEMEEAYRASMLKAFRKTLEEGMFKFVIVDDRNVLIADFAQFWAIAKRSGYEAYIVEAPYTDVKGCAARNVHSFTEEQVQLMADKWEPTPMLYLKLDVLSLFRGDDLNTQDILEVEMDADDVEHEVEVEDYQSSKEIPFATSQSSENTTWGDRWEDKGEPAHDTVSSPMAKRPLERYSLGSGNIKKSNDDALSGLMTTYGKKDKFVHWSDNQGILNSKVGFTIGSGLHKRASLIIGPGPGYNGISNPIVLDENEHPEGNAHRNEKFMEQLRDEQESFKAVFARRRQRIRAVDEDDED